MLCAYIILVMTYFLSSTFTCTSSPIAWEITLFAKKLRNYCLSRGTYVHLLAVPRPISSWKKIELRDRDIASTSINWDIDQLLRSEI
jgi:hypothetical protein